MLKVGKLDSDLLQRIVFDKIELKRDEVITRPGIGRDCAEIDFGEYICTLSTDPITASVKDIGRLAIHISCNDIASNGIEPIGILLSVLLPEGTTEEDISHIMEQAAKSAKESNVEIIGGHTEITRAVNRPVITSTAVGRAKTGMRRDDIKPGDIVMMTGTAGMEGTGIIVTEREEEMRGFLSDREVKEAKEMLNRVSVVKAGVAAGKVGYSGMHDVTEGGIMGAVWEMCTDASVGAYIDESSIPVSPVTKKVCDKLDLDWRRLISSGSMLIIARQDASEKMKTMIDGLAVIGRITDKSEGIRSEYGKIDPPGSDEIYKAV